jgi:transglutaminase-like putative cysteine protease
MKKLLIIVSLLVVFSACSSRHNIPSYSWETDYHNRLLTDFCLDENQVKQYIQKYIPDVTDEQMRQWEKSKALEFMNIDGKKRYFINAGPNLFRIDSTCANIKAKAESHPVLEGEKLDDAENVPAIINAVKQTNKNIVVPKRVKIVYTLTVDTNAVPSGKLIRCWLPYPRTDIPRQKNVRLLSTSESKFILSSPDSVHSTLYMEKQAIKGQPTVFSETFEYTINGEWHPLKPEDIQPYDTTSYLYQKYTSQRATHIIFTPRIRQIAANLTKGITNPLIKAQRIFRWVNDHFPWASSREYSTLKNIPEYVLDNGHGDCGQVSLLFITLCRACGIPAHFQSGFMIHPHNKSLHDWAEVYFQGIGWVPVDQSFGIITYLPGNKDAEYFFLGGIDSYRLIVNSDYSGSLYPAKKYPRSETVDFQRGEVEWSGGNLYFPKWSYHYDVTFE